MDEEAGGRGVRLSGGEIVKRMDGRGWVSGGPRRTVRGCAGAMEGRREKAKARAVEDAWEIEVRT